VQWVSERDWEYAREFNLSGDMLKMPVIMLECDGLDTIAEIYINGKLVAKTDNAYIRHSFDIKNYVSRLTNKIRIKFRSPIAYIEKMLMNTPMISNKVGMVGSTTLRKPSSHFGWCNSPKLPISGITGNIAVVGYADVRLGLVVVVQNTNNYFASITCKANILGNLISDEDTRLVLEMTVTTPKGKVFSTQITKLAEISDLEININSLEYWTIRERLAKGKEPAQYTVKLQILQNEQVVSSWTKKIGLRTIEIDRSKDEFGRKFEIMLNGEKVNIRGQVLTMQDAINPIFDREGMISILDGVTNANMNMVRIFAGAGYQCDEFYTMCDERGILVWQDLPFSSYEHPLGKQEFQSNVARELASRVVELQSHPSLCVICGGYEIELRAKYWLLSGKKVKAIQNFFYTFLPAELEKYDKNIVYIPGTPLSNKFLDRVNSDRQGVAHLWEIWRGMRSIRRANKRTPRFCGEFGMSSMPSIKTTKKYMTKTQQGINSDQMIAHHKQPDGNGRIAYYISTRFRVPRSMEDLAYYSQLTQAEYYKALVEHLRRNMKKCSGIIMGFGNECWPGIDCSMVDYLGNYKAVMYKTQQFNAPIILSLDNSHGTVKVYVINDTKTEIDATIRWYIETFDGDKVAVGSYDSTIAIESSNKTIVLNLKEFLKDNDKDRALVVELVGDTGEVITREIMLFVQNKTALLPDPKLTFEVKVVKNQAKITVTSEKFARYVKVTLEDTCVPFSDNYFDMLAGESKVITIPVARGTKADSLLSKITVRSVANVDQKGNIARDIMKNVGVLFSLRSVVDACKYKLIR